MRKKIENYQSYEVTQDIITQINAISFKRYSEGRYGLLHEDYLSFNDLCNCNNLTPENTYITLGEDWFIIYSNYKTFIELVEWVSLDSAENKFTQTIEMLNEIKKILLLSEGKYIFTIMKHNTSYKFYYDLLIRGYLHEEHHDITLEPFLPSDSDINKIAHTIAKTYGHIADFLKDENRDKKQEEILEDYIYHDISFTITDKFIKKYKK